MIKKLEPADLESVIQIWLEANIAAHNFISADYWNSQLNTVKGQLPTAEVYVYKDTKICGFIGLIDQYIAGIFVSSQEQSKGIGKQLLDFLKKQQNQLTLHVYQKNQRAVNFYLREHFIIQKHTIDEATGEKEFEMVWEKAPDKPCIK